jgi:uncharacterized protein YutE (UPF0331/DUF86 family)
MKTDKLLLLQEGLEHLDQAASHLAFSQKRTEAVIQQENWTHEELERLESLTSRFARLADLLIQKIMRLIDELELTPDGTVLDRIQRAEKRGWIESGRDLVEIRELRNLIAHEYATDRMPEIYQAVSALTPKLLMIVPKIRSYAEQLTKQYSQTTGKE